MPDIIIEDEVVLVKTTSKPGSISLSEDELMSAFGGFWDFIDVRSQNGKLVKRLPRDEYMWRAKGARLLLVNDDPDNNHFYVMDIF